LTDIRLESARCISRLREAGGYPKGRQGGGGGKRERAMFRNLRDMFSFVNVGRRLSFMFKLGTEAGQKRESGFFFCIWGNWEG
jgi:hypothetical protein